MGDTPPAPYVEVLLDNEPWPVGSEALAALAWLQEGDYSAHGFVVLDVRDTERGAGLAGAACTLV